MIEKMTKFDPKFLRVNEPVTPAITAVKGLPEAYKAFCDKHGDPSTMNPGECIRVASDDLVAHMPRFIYNYCRLRGVHIRLYRRSELGRESSTWLIRCHGKWVQQP